MINKQSERIVLIISDGYDYSLKEIGEWVLFLTNNSNVKLLIINSPIEDLKINVVEIDKKTDFEFTIGNNSNIINSNAILGVMIRQARINFKYETGKRSNKGGLFDIKKRYENYLSVFELNIRDFLLNSFKENNFIGYYKGMNLNKLEVLKKAKSLGLVIPKSWLITNKKDLKKLFREGELIVKSIGLGLSFVDEEKKMYFHQLTKLITKEDFEYIPDVFNLTLVQIYISKAFELRIFYLDGDIFTWALMSQSNEQTKIDYRNYDFTRPMRLVPYQLPESECIKINKLMQTLELRTGSIDMIYSINGEYVFLEINPAGQYGYNSESTNFNLNRAFAQSLTEYYEKKTDSTIIN